MSTGRPDRYTGMIAFVRGVIAFSSRSRSMLRVAGSISTNTGVAPVSRITLLVETQVIGVVMTSSPAPTPAIRRPISIVAVPELNERTGRPPQYADNSASNCWFCGPVVIQPERSTSTTPWIVSSSISARTNGRKGSDV